LLASVNLKATSTGGSAPAGVIFLVKVMGRSHSKAVDNLSRSQGGNLTTTLGFCRLTAHISENLSIKKKKIDRYKIRTPDTNVKN
jgi:hypothetical protein